MPRPPRFSTILARLALLIAATLPGPSVHALPNGIDDRDNRYPFVVEIAQRGRMICSGTVLYPRVVVTSAHCVQHVAQAYGKRIYVDSYLQPDELFVHVFKQGRMRSHAVEAVEIAPEWRENDTSQWRTARLPHDMAILVTAAPIDIELPLAETDAIGASLPRPATTGPGRKGVLVAYGGLSCVAAEDCSSAGVRRYLPVEIKDSAECFKSRLDREAGLPEALWCLDENVSPGDSGGALLIEDDDAVLRYVGVISAQRGLPPELAAVFGRRESAATALSANLAFIEGTARSLGYGPAIADP